MFLRVKIICGRIPSRSINELKKCALTKLGVEIYRTYLSYLTALDFLHFDETSNDTQSIAL